MNIETVELRLKEAQRRYNQYTMHAKNTSSIRSMNTYMELANRMSKEIHLLNTKIVNNVL